ITPLFITRPALSYLSVRLGVVVAQLRTKPSTGLCAQTQEILLLLTQNSVLTKNALVEETLIT
ncbi:hypothetical protein DRN98_05170, partial [Methanosarcinales archaeon]